MSTTIQLRVPMQWFDQFGETSREEAMQFASALSDELLADLPEGSDYNIIYDVVDDERYGTAPTAGDWNITDKMIESALRKWQMEPEPTVEANDYATRGCP